MKTISLLDTTVSDFNLGNQIIMEAVNDIINDLFEHDFIFKLQYAEPFGKQSMRYLRQSDYIFFGGTNSLSSQMNRYTQMGFTLSNIFYISNLTLLGVGWWQYQSRPNLYTKYFLKKLLSTTTLHSLRDSYTQKMLSDIGIHNTINTSCPTTWSLTKEHCQKIPINKAHDVITTFTDYNKHPIFDQTLINLLLDNYETVYFWVQGIGDLEYLNNLYIPHKQRLKIIPPKLKNYDHLLKNTQIDYIGTRLHAGIRALQHQQRSLIIAIDNRAKEISNDIGLNIANRDDVTKIIEFIEKPYVTDLTVPLENISKWKEQFK